jgi:hypothetical protein
LPLRKTHGLLVALKNQALFFALHDVFRHEARGLGVEIFGEALHAD